MEKISVIIPAYNAGKYLCGCLDSLINQTYSNLEIIVVNDGSTDDTGKILDKYAEQDPRIIAIHIQNGGVTNARNVGLDKATGDYIGFCDADDYMELDQYEFLLNLIQKYDVEMAHCGYNHITDDEILVVKGTGETYIQNRDEGLRSLLFGGLFSGSLWNKLYKADLLKEIRINPEIVINEDILLNYFVMKKIDKSVFVDIPKYNYVTRKDTGACLNTDFVKKAENSLQVTQIIIDDLEKEGHPLAEDMYQKVIMAYIDLYRCILFSSKHKDKNRLRQIRDYLWDNYKQGKILWRKNRITVCLFKFIPFLYPLLFGLYDRIRVKNIDV